MTTSMKPACLAALCAILATPAANNLVVGSSFGIVLGAPVLILVGIAPRSPWLVVLLAAVYCAILYWVILKAHRKKKA